MYFAGVGICALAHLVQPNFQIVRCVGDALNKLFGHIDISIQFKHGQGLSLNFRYSTLLVTSSHFTYAVISGAIQ